MITVQINKKKVEITNTWWELVTVDIEEVDKLIDDLKQASVILKAKKASKLTNSYATPDKEEVLEELRRDISELKRRVRRLE